VSGSEEQLTDEDTDVLRCLFEHSSCLKMAYEFCHALTSIFDTPLSKREGKRQMRKWMHTVRASELRCFDSFLTTLEKYFDDIAIPSPIWIFGLFYQKRGFKNLIESIG